MIGNGERVLAVVPARGGSKGIPGKNLAELGGRPLLAWAVEVAQRCRAIDRVVVSSESAAILELAAGFGPGVALERPAELSRDDTPGVAPVLHAVSAVPGYDYVVLLQPTSPLRSVEDVEGTLDLCASSAAGSAISVSEARKSPHWMYTLGAGGVMEPVMPGPLIPNRQDLPPAYVINGAVYASRVSVLTAKERLIHEGTAGYVMPEERSYDIDSPADLDWVRFLVARDGSRQP